MNKFIAYDTEGLDIDGDHQTILISNSEGDYLFNRKGLSFNELFDFIVKPAHKTRVWFSFGYDINMIFKNVEREIQTELFKKNNEYVLNNTKIKYYPKKILKIDMNINSNRHKYKINHYDVFGFFQKSFIQSLKDWDINVDSLLLKGKIERIDFNLWEDQQIIKYNALECKLLVQLMDKLEGKLLQNNIYLKHYHGAGAIASYLLRQINADKYKHVNHDIIDNLMKYAYFGGRIELFKRGLFNNIYHYDINSAYPYALTKIPDLSTNKFSVLSNTTENDLSKDLFGLVYAECLDNNPIIAPFPFRLNNGYVVFPQKSKGVYHICEVRSAINKGYNIKLGKSWIYETPYKYPFFDFINDLMIKRLKYKSEGDFAHIPLKLGANSFYGKLAQKASMYKNKWREPIYRDLLMAGFITAFTRSLLLKYCVPNDTILMATDGIYSLSPLCVNIGNNLGDWEYHKHDKGVFILAGIYSTLNDDIWTHKIRGFRDLDVLQLFSIIQKYPYDAIPLKDRRFIGIKYSLSLTENSSKYPMCNFIDIPREIDWNNNRKRVFTPNGDSFSTHDINNQKISAIYKDKFMNETISLENTLGECNLI